MTHWKLSNFCSIVMGQSPKGSDCNFDEQGVPLLNGPAEFGSISPAPKQWTTNPKKFSKEGDLLFCVRASTGRMNWSDQVYAIGRGLAAISPKIPGTIYFFRGVIENYLPVLINEASGSTYSSVNRLDIESIPVTTDDIDYLRRASSIIETVERKIHLNVKMVDVLNKIGRELFNSWFIRFDPIRNKISNNNKIPPPST